MNKAQLDRSTKDLLSQYEIGDPSLSAAQKVAFLEMAHHLDLPSCEDSGQKTIVSGTPNYELTLTSGKDIDRITAAVFVGTTKVALTDWNNRQYLHAYRASATTGVPYAFCFYNDEMWLYYIPNLSGTVYFDCQHIPTDVEEFPDNYYPLMVELTKKHLFEIGSKKWWAANHASKNLMKSFKDKMHPIKAEMEKSRYRALRIQDLNSQN